MKKAFTALALLSLSMTSWSMNFKASIQPVKLPVLLSTSQPPKVKYTPPGEISVGLMRMCGDGDVAQFSQEHANFEFVPQTIKEMDVLIGYWIVEEGASIIPTSSNFFPVGYKKAPISESQAAVSYSGDFLPMNKSFSPGPNGLNLLATELVNLKKIAERSYESQKNYKVFAGAFTCLNPDQKDTLVKSSSSDFKYQPSPIEISHVLSGTQTTGLLGRLKKALDDLDMSSETKMSDFISSYDHIDYKADKTETIFKSSSYEATTQAPIVFKVKNSGDINLSSSSVAWGIFKDVLNIKYPDLSSLPATATETEKLDKFKSIMNSESVASKLSGIPSGAASYCSATGLTQNSTAPLYKWETFPMNLSCKYFLDEGAMKGPYLSLFNPSMLPTLKQFSDYKKAIASQFYIAAGFEAAQKALQSDNSIKIEKPNCFNVGGKPMISRLVGSFPLQFQYDSSLKSYKILSTYNHIHPEPLFALVDYERYFSSDVTGLWGQVLTPDEVTTLQPETWGIQLPIKNKTLDDHGIDSSTFKNSPINIFFKIRSVGGSCPMFC